MTPALTESALHHLPDVIKQTHVQALVFDTVCFFFELAALQLGIPYVHVWNILHLDFSGLTPPCLFDWPYQANSDALTRNIQGLEAIGETLAPAAAIAQAYAARNSLQIDWRDPTATTSRLAIITQTPKEFDFSDSHWPSHFHFAGPFHDDAGREPVPFPWEQLNGKPLIYASMGTLLNGLDVVYSSILAAVRTISDVQVVLVAGSNMQLRDLGPVPPNVLIVDRAPQLELLRRAALCITHAGLNTTLECLAQGVPMVAIPIGYDQPGVAARIAYHGVGEFIRVADLTAERLSALIGKVRTATTYRDKARQFQKIIAENDGLQTAAQVIERAFSMDESQEFASAGSSAAPLNN